MKTFQKDTTEICGNCAGKLGLKVVTANGWKPCVIQSPKDTACFLCGSKLKLSEWWAGKMTDEACKVLEKNPLTEWRFDGVAKELQERFPGYYVHVGDNHISLHRREGFHKNVDGSNANPQLLVLIAKDVI